jgi:hypothetical protein
VVAGAARCGTGVRALSRATAVGTFSVGISRRIVPHAGQRAFFPADSAGAFSFFPHMQRTVITPSPAIAHSLRQNRFPNFSPAILPTFRTEVNKNHHVIRARACDNSCGF